VFSRPLDGFPRTETGGRRHVRLRGAITSASSAQPAADFSELAGLLALPPADIVVVNAVASHLARLVSPAPAGSSS